MRSITNAAETVIAAGVRLIAARSAEAALGVRCCRYPDDELVYIEWARARQHLEKCQAEYIGAVEGAGFPDLGIRRVAEEAEPYIILHRTGPFQNAPGGIVWAVNP